MVTEDILQEGMGRENTMKEKKRVRISSRRQFSIPKNYYDLLGMEDEAVIELYGNRLVVRPVSKDDKGSGDFIEFIYRDVIAEGFQGEDIIDEVELRKKLIKPAVQSFTQDAVENSEPLDIDSLFTDNDEDSHDL